MFLCLVRYGQASRGSLRVTWGGLRLNRTRLRKIRRGVVRVLAEKLCTICWDKALEDVKLELLWMFAAAF